MGEIIAQLQWCIAADVNDTNHQHTLADLKLEATEGNTTIVTLTLKPFGNDSSAVEVRTTTSHRISAFY